MLDDLDKVSDKPGCDEKVKLLEKRCEQYELMISQLKKSQSHSNQIKLSNNSSFVIDEVLL